MSEERKKDWAFIHFKVYILKISWLNQQSILSFPCIVAKTYFSSWKVEPTTGITTSPFLAVRITTVNLSSQYIVLWLASIALVFQLIFDHHNILSEQYTSFLKLAEVGRTGKGATSILVAINVNTWWNVALGSCWPYIQLAQCWCGAGAVLVRCWCGAGTVLVKCLWSAGALLVQCYSVVCITGTVMVQYCYSTGTMLVLCWYSDFLRELFSFFIKKM